MRFVLSRCYVFRVYMPRGQNGEANFSREPPDRVYIYVYRYEGFTVDFVPLREGFYLRRSARGVFEMRTAVPWRIMCIHMWHEAEQCALYGNM